MSQSNQPIRITYAQIFIIVLIALGILLLLAKPVFILEEGEHAVVTRFGQIISVETTAGPKLKLPFIDQVTKYSKKILSWDGEARRIPTFEKQFIWIDPTARWRISDPKKFYASINTMEQAYARLDDLIESSVRTIISQHQLVEAVRNTNNILASQNKKDDSFLPSSNNEQDAKTGEVAESVADDGQQPQTSILNEISNLVSAREIQASIQKGRRELSALMLAGIQEIAPNYGIEVLDVIIRQIRYSDDLTGSVYNRMISERKQKAQVYRSYGEGRKKQLLGQLENEKRSILSKAYSQSEAIKGTADATAAAIYSDAYRANPDFFKFWIAMESYKKTVPYLDKVLSTDIDYFKFLYNSDGR